MRLFLLGVLLLAPSPLLAQTLREGRIALQKGNYAEAQEIYVDLAKEAKNVIPAGLGLSHALELQGLYDAALKALDAPLKIEPNHADLLARKAELLFNRGRWDDATAAANLALKQKDDHFLARFVLAEVLRDSGDWPKADEAFRWFIRTYSERSDKDMDIENPDDLILVGLAGLERARYHHLADQFEFVLNDILGDAAKLDKLYWQAEYQAGRVYSEKHNKAAAEKAFQKTLAINPRAAEVFALRGQTAFSQLEIKEAEFFADQALAINPNLAEALRVKAAVHLFSGENGPAMKLLDQARAINPRDETTLAMVAAVLHAQKKTKEMDAVFAEVAKFNPKAWRFHAELAGLLESRKLLYEAEAYYKKAIDLEPQMPEGHEGLGMLSMRLGKEKEARKLLSDAFDADPFNVRVSNTLKVLDHLGRYETIKTPHYHVRYDPKNDEVLARFVVHYLEKLHEELAKKFDFHPKEPYLIEIFNKHEMFSGRVTALPDLHTIGACTGRMFAMVSTHDKSKVINKPFNWNRVLRHEVVHLFNLDQTGFQIPHWFTEGLAVTLEGKSTPPRWNYILAEKLRENDLLNLDNILLGFARPRSPDQWQQAYLQSQLYVEYLVKTQGEPAVGRLLAAFAEGLDTDGALEKAIKVKKADFEKGYRGFLEERVKNLNLPASVKSRSLKELKEERKKNPEDPEVIAQLAEKHYLIGDSKEALKLADEALRLKLNQPLAAYVKAAVLLGDKKAELALAVLATSIEANPDEPKALRLLARIQFETKNFADAAKSLEQGRKLEPHDPAWLVQLAKVYLQTKDEDKLMDVLKSVAASDPDDLISRTKLAEWFDKKEMPAEAERYAREVLEIDVKNAEGQRILLAALAAQNKNDERAVIQKLLNGE